MPRGLGENHENTHGFLTCACMGMLDLLGFQHLPKKNNEHFREVEVMARQMGDLLWQRDVPPPDFSVPRMALRKATVDGSEIPNNQMTWC